VRAPIGSPERFYPRLIDALGARRWALTLQAGASLVVRHAVWETIHVYVEDLRETVQHLAHEIGWERGEGKLVLLEPHYADSAWFGMRAAKRVNVVSDLQLVLDLWHYPVRGREQAELLLERMERDLRGGAG
jgi:hypothetical protein